MALVNATAWTTLASDNDLNRMICYSVLKLCNTIRSESPLTPNHLDRLDWVNKFWPAGADPADTIPTAINQIKHLVYAQADVAYAIGVSSYSDAIMPAIDTVVASTCPAAA